MSKTREKTEKPGVGIALPIAVCVITLGRAAPSLLDAWKVDIYARGAWIAFLIWVAAQAYARFTSPRRHEKETGWWLVAAITAGLLGALCNMRVFDNASLCFAITGLFSVGWTSAISIVAATSWMPATGYFIGKVWEGGLQGWERPLAALLFSIAFIATNLWRKAHSEPLQPS